MENIYLLIWVVKFLCKKLLDTYVGIIVLWVDVIVFRLDYSKGMRKEFRIGNSILKNDVGLSSIRVLTWVWSII